ncbi:MAG: hypothetical protein N2111_01240 [Candidatus Sumerlaeaceae bacterium]|nr:hypothetical protein [Candidatus Sumerlaeaceae bacterium]
MRSSRWQEWALPLEAVAPGRGVARLQVNGVPREVPVAVFRPREFFLCLVLSSNHHVGFDPYGYLFGGGPENLVLEGDAWPKLRQLERMCHMRNLPVTWLIDDRVARKAAADISRWRTEFGDEYGVLPPSRIHHNAVNYNTERSAAETLDLLEHCKSATESCFDFFTDTIGVDQFVGSVGGHFTEAARDLGACALWGMGFDHRTCDTSMYHRGCPWDTYRASLRNYRIPANGGPGPWMFQWTTRDAMLSLRSPDDGPGGAVIFSTDPDDMRNSRIMFEQPDYWSDLLSAYRANFSAGPAHAGDGLNDYFCFLIHQEDHDCHFPENADLLRRFLDATAGQTTPATIGEVAEWLSLRYGADSHPAQALWMPDLLRCHDRVVWYAGVRKPADWPAGGETYPPAILYYDSSAMWYVSDGEPLPRRFFDYGAQHPVAETDVYPERDLRREVTVTLYNIAFQGAHLVLQAAVTAPDLTAPVPVVFWHVLGDALARPSPERRRQALLIRDSVVVFVPVRNGAGTTTVHIDLGVPQHAAV